MAAPEVTWFSARTIFRHEDLDTYEERVTLWRARSSEEAIELAEAEADKYCSDGTTTFLGLTQAFQLYDEPGHGAEIYSLMRDSELEPDPYLDAFFDTGHEHQQD